MRTTMKDIIFISLILFINSIPLNNFLYSQYPLTTNLLQNEDFGPLTCLYGYKPESLTGIATPIRLNRNYDIECLSFNGKDCIWNEIHTGHDCFKNMLANEGKFKPLVCGKMHKEVHGIEGYGNSDHWCEIGRKWYFNNWHCNEEHGLPNGIRIDSATKNVECLSSNGKDCVTDFRACQRAKTSRRHCKFTKPLRCGSENMKFFNNTNPYYDPLQNWCKLGNKFLFGETDWICGGDLYGQDIPFRYNTFGDIECFSINGKDCAWGFGTGTKCTEYVKNNIRNVNPLTCGAMHNAIYGGDGYSTKEHWCRKLMDSFVLTTRNY